MNRTGRNRVFLPLLSMLAILGSADVARSGVNTWTALGPEGATVTELAIDPVTPSTLYAAGHSGVFKSTNGGSSWSPVNAGLGGTSVNTLAIDPATPSNLYAGTRGVYKSSNGGTSWKAITAGLARLNSVYMTALAIDSSNPTTLYAGAMEYGCEGPCAFKSTDGGENWRVMGDGRIPSDVLDFAIDPTNAATLYAATYGFGVFKSTDGGESWSAINVGLTSNLVYALAIDPSAPTTLYAGTYRGGVLKTTDGGANWTAINMGLAGGGSVRALAINPEEPTTLYAGTEVGVFSSRNSGESWAPMNVGLLDKFVRSLAIDPANPARLYAGTPGGVFEYLSAPRSCGPASTTLCLNNGRIAVTAEWFDRDGAQGSAARAVGLTADAGYFTFFDAANVEVLVKVLNGCGLNSRYWTFAAGLTDLEVILTVTDTLTASVRTYSNAAGVAFQPVQDTAAFATCP